MLHTWFEVKVRLDKTLETGIQKKVTEVYLFDSLSFSEAEAFSLKEITPFVNGGFEVSDIKKAKINEIFYNEDGDEWYLCKVNFITLDEKSGIEKRQSSKMLVQASNLTESLQVLKDGMLGTMADWEVVEVKKTAIMDVYKYKTKDKVDNE